MRESRQITVLRSLFKTLHPVLTSGLKSELENRLAPAKRLLTGAQAPVEEHPQQVPDTSTGNSTNSTDQQISTTEAITVESSPVRAEPMGKGAKARPPLPPLPRTLTDEHLVAELENATRQYEVAEVAPRKPARSRRHYSRDTLLSLLEEAKVRIQVLETELELARGTEEHIPLLTEEWADDLPSTLSRKPD